MAPYVRKVPTASNATAVQVIWSKNRGRVELEHIGSAHSQVELEVLLTLAEQRIAEGQDPLPLVVPTRQQPTALEILDSRMGRLLDALGHAYRQLGLDAATGRDKVFEELVTARILEPPSKRDAARVLEEAGLRPVSYPTVKRRLPGYAAAEFRHTLSGALAARAPLGQSALVLYNVTTLLCRRRHNRVYADLLVMPMFVVLPLAGGAWAV